MDNIKDFLSYIAWLFFVVVIFFIGEFITRLILPNREEDITFTLVWGLSSFVSLVVIGILYGEIAIRFSNPKLAGESKYTRFKRWVRKRILKK
jgi:predicted permease